MYNKPFNRNEIALAWYGIFINLLCFKVCYYIQFGQALQHTRLYKYGVASNNTLKNTKRTAQHFCSTLKILRAIHLRIWVSCRFMWKDLLNYVTKGCRMMGLLRDFLCSSDGLTCNTIFRRRIMRVSLKKRILNVERFEELFAYFHLNLNLSKKYKT